MSIMPMYKRCPNCKRQFTYNPDIGDLGLVCPHCNKVVVISAVYEGKDVLKAVKKFFKDK